MFNKNRYIRGYVRVFVQTRATSTNAPLSTKGRKMVLKNKLNITNQVELAKAEEKLSKQKAKEFFSILAILTR